MERENTGTLGWAGLIGGVALYDVWAMRTDHETLSHAFHRHMEHPLKRTLMIGAATLTLVHLFKVIDRDFDIYYGFGLKDKA